MCIRDSTRAPAEAETPAKKGAAKEKSPPPKGIHDENPAQKDINNARKAVGWGKDYCICIKGEETNEDCPCCMPKEDWDAPLGGKRPRAQTKPL